MGVRAAQEQSGEEILFDAESRGEKLLHLLQVGRDCVDSQLVRWALRLHPEEDVNAFLAARRRICGSSVKTGLVRHLGEATPKPATDLSAHPELLALESVLRGVMDIFIGNGNEHVSYWHLEDAIQWGQHVGFAGLRAHFTLPRLLAFFSLFDHNFARQSCALSPRNYAAFGAERFVKRRLLEYQNGHVAEPFFDTVETDGGGSGKRESAAGGCKTVECTSPMKGEFVSVVHLMQLMRWTSTFGPHIGDFLEWAWCTPGIELGVRVSGASCASKHIPLESQDRSEKTALRAVVTRLSGRASLTEHIASCRQAIAWREYGLGPLDKFVRKYTAWFAINGEYITLLEDRRVDVPVAPREGHTQQDEHFTNPYGAHDLASPEPQHASGGREEALLDSESDEEDVPKCDIQLSPCPEAGRVWTRAPKVFAINDGLAYHEACLEQALRTPLPESIPAPMQFYAPSYSGELASSVGAEVANFAREHSLACDDWSRRSAIRLAIHNALISSEPFASEFPNLQVTIIGTSGSGLGRKDSDLDMFIDLDGRGNREVRRARIPGLLDAAAAALQSVDVTDVELVPTARIPLLRGLSGGIRFDLSIGTPCGVWNTALLGRFAAQDPARVLPLCTVVVAWSKAQGINDSPNGLLSTYSLLLFVLFFLQKCGAAPEVDLADVASRGLGMECPPTLPSTELPHAALGKLLVDFFVFAACFRWDAWVASVRCGAALPRTAKSRPWQVQPMCIEDPFETHLNTCRRVNPRGQRKIMCAVEAALRLLLAGEGVAGLLSPSGQRPVETRAARRGAAPAN